MCRRRATHISKSLALAAELLSLNRCAAPQPHTPRLFRLRKQPTRDTHEKRKKKRGKRKRRVGQRAGRGGSSEGGLLGGFCGKQPPLSEPPESQSLQSLKRSHRASPAPVYHCSGGGTARAPGLITAPNALHLWRQHVLGNGRAAGKAFSKHQVRLETPGISIQVHTIGTCMHFC